MNPANLNDIVKCCRCDIKFKRLDGEFMCIRLVGQNYINYYICDKCLNVFNNQYRHKLITENGHSWDNWDDVFFKLFLNQKTTFIFR